MEQDNIRSRSLLLGLIIASVAVAPVGWAAEEPGEYVTHAHAEIVAESGSCAGTYNVHVSAKMPSNYDWMWRVTIAGETDYDHGNDFGPLNEGDNDIFDLEEGETIELVGSIHSTVNPNDFSHDTASGTCEDGSLEINIR